MPSVQKQTTLVIDQGTSSTKVFLFNLKNQIVFKYLEKHFLVNTKPGHVEADAHAIARTCKKLIQLAGKFADQNNFTIIASGMTFQRSTFLFWDRQSIKPLTPALSWQDSRASNIVKEFSDFSDSIFIKTGAPLNPHFGGPKFAYLTRNDPNLKMKAIQGKVVFGTISAYLTHYLTGNCLIDESIASRFTLMDLVRRQWDDELLSLFETPKACLPKLTSSVNNFGTILVNKKNIPLLVVIGDQQAALIGQGGFTTNAVAMNFGTSGSIQINVGKKSTHVNGLISSILYSDQKEHFYILEGTINACNSLFYQLEKELKIPHKQMRWDDRCTMTKTEGVYVPTFSGLASPYWVDEYNLVSKGYGNNLPNEIIRAGMESIGLLVNDILSLAKSKLKDLPNNIMASGGGARPSLLQFISDLTGITVHRSPMKDRTALGVHALLNKTHNGKWPMINISHKDGYLPKMIQSERKIKIERWKNALLEAGVK